MNHNKGPTKATDFMAKGGSMVFQGEETQTYNLVGNFAGNGTASTAF